MAPVTSTAAGIVCVLCDATKAPLELNDHLSTLLVLIEISAVS